MYVVVGPVSGYDGAYEGKSGDDDISVVVYWVGFSGAKVE